MRPFANHFNRLIGKYSVTAVLLIPGEAGYDAGKYIQGPPQKKEIRGAIIPLPERKIYQPGGNFTEKDRHLFLKTPLDCPLEGAKVEYQRNTYSIEEETDHTDYADIAVYVLKWVSSFDRQS